MKVKSITLVCTLSALLLLASITCSAANYGVTFTKLTGVTGGSIAQTGVYRADLSGLGINILSITIQDNSGGTGGSPGAFSGFDLDGIKLSSSSWDSASDAASDAGLGVFDFSPANTLFTAGTQRAPVVPALYGTSGGNIDNALATLQFFDGESSTVTPFGFVSLGDSGRVSFNLTSSVSTSGLYLYIGEVGDNGEVAAGTISVSDKPAAVPEPATLLGFGLPMIMIGLGKLRNLRK
jgi:hypothetical protein